MAYSAAKRRRRTLPDRTVSELDDLCMQAANDALVAVTQKLDNFKGLSRFTTWASKFAILEVSSRLRCHAWRDRRVEWSDASWERLQEPASSAERQIVRREELSLLRRALTRDLTDRQRMILTSAVFEEVPIDVLAERLGSSRGAVYKILHDARARLRRALNQGTLMEGPV
jgi:RNA polymerase sigma-70 factor (ECF subfamily)